MQVDFNRVDQSRRRLAAARRGAWLVLVLSVIAVGAWDRLGGPQPEDFGYRFSPMYTFSPTGMVFWSLVACVMAAVAAINYLYLGINVRLRCPACGSAVPVKARWACGHCGGDNRPLYGGIKDSYYTLLTECKHCHRAPAGCTCAACGTSTGFDGTAAAAGAARLAPEGGESVPGR